MANPRVWPSLQSLLDLRAVARVQDNIMGASNFHINERVKASVSRGGSDQHPTFCVEVNLKEEYNPSG